MTLTPEISPSGGLAFRLIPAIKENNKERDTGFFDKNSLAVLAVLLCQLTGSMQFLTHSNSPCLALSECGYPWPPFSGCQAGPQQTPLFGNKLRCAGLESVQTQLFLTFTISLVFRHSMNRRGLVKMYRCYPTLKPICV